ncbi:hypothetical protein GCM10010401_11220 [Rarobacter faecitabidus]|uniref:NAD(P)H-flavin reductase n=1 Tax=Rarobacter faecitabidus TaxID=13243 RepID=A0A542ZP90_RARFA|nr:FAD-dependent oxidoreductase [Rarobacter faecitabidus]TQL62137.1 NAD(P)H-flavin reductase [Rarobacter faecitabidus]
MTELEAADSRPVAAAGAALPSDRRLADAGRRWLSAADDLLARQSMHRLTLVLLAALAAIAIALAAADELPFDPVAMLATLGVLIVVSVAVTWLGGFVVRRRPLPESALITALLLFFLFWPSTDPATLAWYAAGAAIAAASKYLAVWRGAHIFNPAAVGAVVLAVTGKAAVIWWVGSSILIIPVILAALAVTRRSGTLRFAASMWLAATAVTTVTLIGDGVAVQEAARTALLSYPWLFWAAFMVTEPMTAPRRVWHRWVAGTAMIAAIALPVRVDLGAVHIVTSPELVLIAGNVIAFALGRPRATWARVVARSGAAADSGAGRGVLGVTLLPDRDLALDPGQWVEVQLARGGFDRRGARRIFTPIRGRMTVPGDRVPRYGDSAPGELTVLTRLPARPSRFKRALASSEVGTRVRITRAGGSFTLPLERETPLLLVGGGIGITPLLAFLADLGPSCGGRDIVVLYQIGSAGVVLGEGLLRASGVRVVLVTDPGSGLDGAMLAERSDPTWTIVESRRITSDLLAEHVGDVVWRSAFVSGPPAMVRSTAHELRRAGVVSVRRDEFFGA